jgi:hypothetical protein
MKNRLTARKTEQVKISVPDLQNDVEAIVNLRDTEGVQAYQDALSKYKGYASTIETLVEEYDRLSDIVSESQALSDNEFLNYLTFRTVDDKTTIGPKREFRRTTENVKDSVRKSFLELPQSLQNKFVDYQLLRFGIDDKIGSLMDMLPQDLHLKLLKDISQANKNKADYLKENMPLIERNTMLSLAKDMPQYLGVQQISRNEVAFMGDMEYVKNDDVVYKKTGDNKMINGNSYNVFESIMNEDFSAGEHFVKFGKDLKEKKEVSNDEATERKNNC